MSIRSRHRFVIDRLMCGFAFDSIEILESLITEDQCFEALSRFFSSDGSNSLYFVQKRVNRSSDAVIIPAESLFAFESLTASSFREFSGNFGKVAIFCKTAAYREKNLDTNVYDDNSLTFMVISDPIIAYKTIVDGVCKDLMRSTNAWGCASQIHSEEFSQSVSMISRQIEEGNKSMDGRPKLRRVEKSLLDLSNDEICSRTSDVKAISEIFENWIIVLVDYLNNCKDRSKWDNPDSEITSEIEYWKSRDQNLRGLSDEIYNSESCKKVVSVMEYAASPSTSIDSQLKQRISLSLLQWHKNIEGVNANAMDETQDTLMCIRPLEKLSEQLMQAQEQPQVAVIVGSVTMIIDNIMSFSRYFVTSQNITRVFTKLTNQLISICRNFLVNDNVGTDIWDQDIDSSLTRMDNCILLNEIYQMGFRQWKERVSSTPKGRLLDLVDGVLFGKFDLFCRRLLKLMDMFSMIAQMKQLKNNSFEDFDDSVNEFELDVAEFRKKKHNLLDFTMNRFDRDYVDFSEKIKNYEGKIQEFVDKSFLCASTIESSLQMLEKLKAIIYRDNIRKTMNGKLMLVMKKFGVEIERLSSIYERQKDHPPVPRNIPIAAGSIMWSRYLLNRIERSMNKFQSMCYDDEPTDEDETKKNATTSAKPSNNWVTKRMLFSSLESKKIVNSYNKLARTLLAFEFLWFDAWRRSVEKAKTGLQATLLVCNPENEKIYVNFDPSIAQMIHEATWMSRFGHKLPESVKLIALQRESFKSHYNELLQVIADYDRAIGRVIGVTAKLMSPHLETLKLVMQPGLQSLTWTSMNISSFIRSLSNAIKSFEDMVKSVNDILENRVQTNLKVIAKTIILNLPSERSVSLDEFVLMQESNVDSYSISLSTKSNDTECAIEDIISIMATFPTDPRVVIALDDLQKDFFEGYHKLMYQAVLSCVKSALLLLKKRACGRAATSFFSLQRPFFEVDIQLSVPSVKLSPGLDDVQRAINHSAVAILGCSKKIYKWGQRSLPETRRRNFFDMLGKDLEIIKTVLLLTGAILGTRKIIHKYLDGFKEFDWLWRDDKDSALPKHNDERSGRNTTEANVSEYELELRRFVSVEVGIDNIASFYSVGAIVMNSSSLKSQLKSECRQWKLHVSSRIHEKSRSKMNNFIQFMKRSVVKLNTTGIDSIDSLASVMKTMKEIREKDSSVEEEELSPILDVYSMLERYIPMNLLYPLKEEIDQKLSLRTEWKSLTDMVETSADNLNLIQGKFKRQLIGELKEYAIESKKFHQEYDTISSRWKADSLEAINESITHTKKQCMIHLNKKASLRQGEVLFSLQGSGLNEMSDVERCLEDVHQMESLVAVCHDLNVNLIDIESMRWTDIVAVGNFDKPRQSLTNLTSRLNAVSGNACALPIYRDYTDKLRQLMKITPLLEVICHKGMKKRHFTEMSSIAGVVIINGAADSDSMKKGAEVNDIESIRIGSLISDNVARLLLSNSDQIKEMSIRAEKELQIENNLLELQEAWKSNVLKVSVSTDSSESKDLDKSSNVYLLENNQKLLDMMEDALMSLQTMMGSLFIAPFRIEAEKLYEVLSNASETLESWSRVQRLYISIRNVFSPSISAAIGSEQLQISKQLPTEYRKFTKLSKEWERIMIRTCQSKYAMICCQNEDLVATLPMMSMELERCQRSLNGYLEQKRAIYPRLYLVSDDMLLNIMCQEVESLVTCKEMWRTMYDGTNSIEVTKDAGNIYVSAILEVSDKEQEAVYLHNRVKVSGNIESWLCLLEETVKSTIRRDMERLASTWSFGSLNEAMLDSELSQSQCVAQGWLWTSAFEAAISQQRSNKRAMVDFYDDLKSFLTDVCKLQPRSSLRRSFCQIKLDNLVQLISYQCSVVSDIIAQYSDKKVKQSYSKGVTVPQIHIPSNTTFFSWHCRPRTYWHFSSADSSDAQKVHSQCNISLADAHLPYRFEHMSCEMRMIITPTHERCLVAMACSISSGNLGCHVFGDPAVGKMSLIKEFGNTLGMFVVRATFFETHLFSDVTRIVAGIEKSGLLGCFQGLHNLSPSVLSAVSSLFTNLLQIRAQQLSSDNRNTDLRSNASNQPSFGIFCLSEMQGQSMKCLSEQLAHLLRPCYLEEADIDIIIKTKLLCLGFDDFEDTGKRLSNCLRALNKRFPSAYNGMLSSFQRLYCSIANAVKQPSAGMDKNSTLGFCCRDTFLPMHSLSERSTFLSMMQEYFDLASSDQKKSLAINTRNESPVFNSLQENDYLIIVGPTCSGKSFDLRKSIEDLNKAGASLKHVTINPDSVSLGELFGDVDTKSQAWKSGIFSTLVARAEQTTSKDCHCIIFDGSINKSWTEGLSSLISDSPKQVRNESIAISSKMKLIFETDKLQHASPSFLSKMSIVSKNVDDISWDIVLISMLSQWLVHTKYHADILSIFSKYFGTSKNSSTRQAAVINLMNSVSAICECSFILLFKNCSLMFCCCLEKMVFLKSDPTQDQFNENLILLERAIIFSFIWGVAGFMNPNDWVKIDLYVRDIVMRSDTSFSKQEPDVVHSVKSENIAEPKTNKSTQANSDSQKKSKTQSKKTTSTAPEKENHDTHEKLQQKTVITRADILLPSGLTEKPITDTDVNSSRSAIVATPSSKKGHEEKNHQEKVKGTAKMNGVTVEVPSIETPKKINGRTLFDFTLNMDSFAWEAWKIGSVAFDRQLLQLGVLIAPTINICRSQSMAMLLLGCGLSVTIRGSSGCGKTSLLQFTADVMQQDERILKYFSKKYSRVPTTTSTDVQKWLEKDIQRKGGKNFGPPTGYDKIICFIDDLNFNEKEEVKDISVEALLKQILETKSIWNMDSGKRGEQKYLDGFLAIVTESSCKSSVSPRLLNNYGRLSLSDPTSDSITSIFSSIVKDIPMTDISNIGQLVLKRIPTVTVDLFLWYKGQFKDDNNKLFNIGFSFLFSAMSNFLSVSPVLLRDEFSIILTWRHEIERSFRDLLELQEKEAFDNYFSQAIFSLTANPETEEEKDMFLQRSPEKESKQSSTAGAHAKQSKTAPRPSQTKPSRQSSKPAVDSSMRLIDIEKVKERIIMTHGIVVNDSSSEYSIIPQNAAELVRLLEDKSLLISKLLGKSVLVNEGYANRVTTACASIGRAGTVTVIYGSPGMGKKTLAEFSSQLLGLKTLVIGDSSNFQSIDQDRAGNLRTECYRCLSPSIGRLNNDNNLSEPTKINGATIIVNDMELCDTFFLKLLCDISLEGDCSLLFDKDEMNRVEMEASKELKGSTSKAKISHFISTKLRSYFRIVLCISNSRMFELASSFISSIPNIVHLQGWPIDFYKNIASDSVSSIELSKEALKSINIDNFLNTTANVHKTILSCAQEYNIMNQGRLSFDVSDFRSFVADSLSILHNQFQNITDRSMLLKCCVNRLDKMQEDNEKMKKTLIIEENRQRSIETLSMSMFEKLEIASLDSNQSNQEFQSIQSEYKQNEERINHDRETIERALTSSMPCVEEAERALGSVRQADLNDLKKMAKPADIAKLVFDCIAIVRQEKLNRAPETQEISLGVGKERKTFNFVKDSYKLLTATPGGMVNDPRFLQSLALFCRNERDMINSETLEFLQPYLLLDGMSPSVARNCSRAVEGLLLWIKSLNVYCEESLHVRPMIDEMKIRESSHHTLTQTYAKLETKLKESQSSLNRLQSTFDQEIDRKRQTEEAVLNIKRRITRSASLLQDIQTDRDKICREFADIPVRLSNLVGNSIITAAYINYLCAFNSDYRQFVSEQKLLTELQKQGIASNGLLACHDLVNPELACLWSAEGLLSDCDADMLRGGLCILWKNSKFSNSRTKLVVDPQQAALTWLKNHFKDSPILNFNDQSRNASISAAVANGDSLVVCCSFKSESELDSEAEIRDIIDNRVYSKVRGEYCTTQILKTDVELFTSIGGSFIRYNPNFNLILVTSSVSFISQRDSCRLRIIDFSMNEVSYKNSILDCVAFADVPTMNEQLTRLKIEELSNRNDNALFIETFLKKIDSCNEGSIIENDDLLSDLIETKKKLFESREKLAATSEFKSDIMSKRSTYGNISKRLFSIYSTIITMENVNPLYTVLFPDVLDMFQLGVKQTEKTGIQSKKLSNIMDSASFFSCQCYCSRLSPTDKITFLLSLMIKILGNENLIPSNLPAYFEPRNATTGSNSNKPEWIGQFAWNLLERLQRDLSKYLRGLTDSFLQNEPVWREWYLSTTPELTPIPFFEDSMAGNVAVIWICRTLLIQCLRPERLIRSVLKAVEESISIQCSESVVGENSKNAPTTTMPLFGQKYRNILLQDWTQDLQCCAFKDSISKVSKRGQSFCPSLLIIPKTDSESKAAFIVSNSTRKLGFSGKIQISSASASANREDFINALQNASLNADWMTIFNPELAESDTLNEIVSVERKRKPNSAKVEKNTGHSSNDMSEGFRLLLVIKESENLPLDLSVTFQKSFMQSVNTLASNVKKRIMSHFLTEHGDQYVDQERLGRVDSPFWKSTVAKLVILFSFLEERRAVMLETNRSILHLPLHIDLMPVLDFVERELESQKIPQWDSIRSRIVNVFLFQHCIDVRDKKLLENCLIALFPDNSEVEKTLEIDGIYNSFIQKSSSLSYDYIQSFNFAISNRFESKSQARGVQYAHNSFEELQDSLTYLQPESTFENLLVHPRDLMTYSLSSCNMVSASMSHCLSNSRSTLSLRREDVVLQLNKIPIPIFSRDGCESIENSQRFNHEPCNLVSSFMIEEIDEFSNIIAAIRRECDKAAVMFQVDKSDDSLQPACEDEHIKRLLLRGIVPSSWNVGTLKHSLTGVLSEWVENICKRHSQYLSWAKLNLLETDKSSAMFCFWLPGLFNPTGLIQSMYHQEMKAKRVRSAISSESMTLHFEMTTTASSAIDYSLPSSSVLKNYHCFPSTCLIREYNGIFVSGIRLDNGACWSRDENTLSEVNKNTMMCRGYEESSQEFLPVCFVCLADSAAINSMRQRLVNQQLSKWLSQPSSASSGSGSSGQMTSQSSKEADPLLYECPIYDQREKMTTPTITINLPVTPEKPSQYWKTRGVCGSLNF